MVRRISVLVSLTFFLLIMSGCWSRVQNAPSPSNEMKKDISSAKENNTTKIPEESMNNLQMSEHSINEAWGDVSIIHKEYFFRPRCHLSISDSGELLSAESSSITENPDTSLIVANILNDTEEVIREVKWPVQISYGRINSEWIVWKEVTGASVVSDKCEIYGYDRKNKSIKLYYRNPVDKEGHSFGHEPVPDLKGHEFLIDVVSAPNSEGLSTITSRRYNLANGKYEDIAEQLALPKWSSNGIIGMGEDKERKGYSLLFRLEDGLRKSLSNGGAYIYDYSTDGESVLMSAQRFKTDNPSNEAQVGNIILVENGNELALTKPSVDFPSGYGGPSLSKRIAMWGYGGLKAYAYDRKLKKIVNLSSDEQRASNYYTNDKYLFWTSPSKQDIEKNTGDVSMLNIIDLDMLPQ